MAPVNREVKYRQATTADRRTIFFAVRASIENGRPKQGIFSEIARQLGFSRKLVSRHYHTMKKQFDPLLSNHPDNEHALIIHQNAHIFAVDHSSRKKGKFKYDRNEIQVEVKKIPFKKRRSIRKLARRLKLPKSSVHDLCKPQASTFHRHKSKLKPTLTELNKLSRFNFALEQIDMTTVDHEDGPYFDGQYNKVFIDEKWFNLCQDGESYILCEGEEAPKRQVKHKNYIEKVMFLCAQARPRWDTSRNCWWDGKIGIWPIGKYTKAQRRSANRPAGTIEWENITIDNENYKDLLVNEVITSIMTEWPQSEWRNPNYHIFIQQDGAGGHCSHSDAYLGEALEAQGIAYKVSMYTQPANSPDLNILDLGLFNALQAAYYDEAPSNAVQIIELVKKTYKEYPRKMIDRLFVTFQSVLNCIIEHHGDNQFPLPHMGKDKLERLGQLPKTIPVTAEAMSYIDADMDSDNSDDDDSIDLDAILAGATD